jgi:hypothetical protein
MFLCVRVQRCLKVFEGYPEAFLEVVRETDPRAVAEHGIFTRQAEALPADGWGRGRVTLIGDAAHPVRPTGASPLVYAIDQGFQYNCNVRPLGLLASRPSASPAGLKWPNCHCAFAMVGHAMLALRGASICCIRWQGLADLAWLGAFLVSLLKASQLFLQHAAMGSHDIWCRHALILRGCHECQMAEKNSPSHAAELRAIMHVWMRRPRPEHDDGGCSGIGVACSAARPHGRGVAQL